MKTLLVLCVLLLAACSRPQTPVASAPADGGQTAMIAWLHPTTMAEVDAAFDSAQAKGQPVFLFWTASWCPPCNQVKSTVFTREEFITRTRSFVPLYIDGDTPGGQAIGKRFKVSAYPTMVLLSPKREELTRLAGSVEPSRYLQLLDLGLKGGNSARQTLAAALAGQMVNADDWRLLAYHSWLTDEQQLVNDEQAPAVLMKLALACPPSEREAASRLVLQALATAASAKPSTAPAVDKSDARASVVSLLAQPDLVREHHDLFAHAADDIVGFLTEPGSPERAEMVATWKAALDRLSAERTLGNAARLWVTSAKVNLTRLDHKGELPAALLAEVRAEAARADRETSDLDERQSVITSAGGMLSRAGLPDEAEALLSAELARSHSPYYYMLGLAANERRRGTPAGKAAALEWARQAYEASTGPATRIEWGASYLRYLIDLAPGEADRIEETAAHVVAELQPQPGAFSGRSQRVLERASERMLKWSDGRHDARLARIHATLVPLCDQAAESADRAGCKKLFAPVRS
jgi:thioredoxin-related protein